MRLVLLSFLAVTVLAQEGAPIRISPAPVSEAYTQILHYTANIADYTCLALSSQPGTPSTITVSAISNANPGSMTATAHGFYFATGVTQKFAVWISGLTGNWTPLNGVHVLTPTAANALATDVDTTTFGAVTGTIVVSTRAPKVTDKVWSVQPLVSDGSGNLTIIAWPVITSSITSLATLTGGTNAFKFACTAPTSYQ
jgi:hypothetical protein